MYYLLGTSIDDKEIGHYPQCDGAAEPYKFRGPQSVWKINQWKPIDFDIKIPIYKLHKKAKFTDNLNVMSLKSLSTLLVSPVLFNLLKQFDLPAYQCYPTEVVQGQIRKPYYCIYFSDIHNNYIDFERSLFYKSYALRSKNRPIATPLLKFKNAADYNQQRKALLKQVGAIQRYYYYHLYLAESKIELDLFRIYGFCAKIVVSERLKKALEQSKLTGFRLLPFESLSPKPMLPELKIIPYNEQKKTSK